MSITEKERKKLRRKLWRIDEKQDIIITTLVIWLFIIFCMATLFDQIIGKIFWREIRCYQGLGWVQLGVSTVCIVNMWWLKKVMK